MENKHADSDLNVKIKNYDSTFDKMKELHEKLLVLDYTKSFLNQYKIKPIHNYYFSTSTNSSEQFYTFICLSEWLIKTKCNLSFKNDFNIENYDDPDVYIYDILDVLRSFGKTVDFAPNKLKQGHGPEIISILNSFADRALEKIDWPDQIEVNIVNLKDNFNSSNVDLKDDEYEEEDEEEEAKYLFENQEYTLIDDEYDDLSEEIIDDSLNNSINTLNKENFSVLNKPIINTTTNTKDWYDEVNQMLPQLKLANKLLDENNNWRLRFDELKKKKLLINVELKNCDEGLGRLEKEIKKILDRLDSRERYVQQQLDALCNELLAYRSELSKSMENYQQINGGVLSKSRKLAELGEKIEKIKADIENREQEINDKTPLVLIKKALINLKTELNELNIRIGVSLRNVLEQKLQKNSNNNLTPISKLDTFVLGNFIPLNKHENEIKYFD